MRLTWAEKEFIKNRQGRKCRNCGQPETKKNRLTIHHIDHNHRNNNPKNLVAWCVDCHRTYHRMFG